MVLRISHQRFRDKSAPCLWMRWAPCALGHRQQRDCAQQRCTNKSPPGRRSTNRMAPVSYTQVSAVGPLGAPMFKGRDRKQLLSRPGEQSTERDVMSSPVEEHWVNSGLRSTHLDHLCTKSFHVCFFSHLESKELYCIPCY